MEQVPSRPAPPVLPGLLNLGIAPHRRAVNSRFVGCRVGEHVKCEIFDMEKYLLGKRVGNVLGHVKTHLEIRDKLSLSSGNRSEEKIWKAMMSMMSAEDPATVLHS